MYRWVAKPVAARGCDAVLILEHRFAHIPQEGRRGRAWLASLPPLYEGRLADGAIVSLNASLRYYHLGDIVLAVEDGPAQIIERTPHIVATQALDHLVLRTHASGRAQVTTNARTAEAASGDLLLIDLARPISIAMPPVIGVAAVVPRRLLANGRGASGLLSRHVLVADRDPLIRLLAGHLIHLADVLAAATEAQVAELVPATVALCRAIDTSGGPAALGSAEGARDAASPTVLAVRRYIEEHLDSVDVPGLMEHFGLSRRSLYRLFEGTGGVQACIRDCRLAFAMRALRQSPTARRPKLARLAHDCGIGDPRVFSRAFRRRYGMSPTEVEPGSTPALLQRPDTGLLGWLRTL